ncbi:MAG: hypothetical protein GY759_11630 [Chloroflexi bacterium]|nr:hypothetical protein [Chloroflexota bacterium]
MGISLTTDATFEEVYQAWLDVETLFDIRENIDVDSLRMAEIDQGLRDFTVLVYFELPQADVLETIRVGRRRLQPLLACVTGSTAPTMTHRRQRGAPHHPGVSPTAGARPEAGRFGMAPRDHLIS